jgi:tetratricopeptide (TPR) repeat protein
MVAQNRHEFLKTLPGRRLLIGSALLLVTGILTVAVSVVYRWQAPMPEPPQLDLSQADPPARMAIRSAQTAVARSPRSATAWGQLGVVFLAFECVAEASTCFACAERLDPQDPRWPYLQVPSRGLNDPDTIPRLQRAVALSANPPDDVRLHLAEALAAQGRRDEAEQQFQAVIRHDSSNARAHLGLARLAFSRQQWSETETALQQALASPFTRKAACLLLAQVHQVSGHQAAAERDAQQLAKLPEDKPYPSPYFAEEIKRLLEDKSAVHQAEELVNQGHRQEAIVILHQLATKYPDWGPVWLHLGELLVEAGRYPAAEPVLRHASELTADSAKPHFYLGVIMTEQGRHQAAAACFRRATELYPSYAEAYLGLSRCLQAQGDIVGATQALRTAIVYVPTYVDARVTLGELLARNGQPAEGLEQLQCAARLRPDDDRIQKLIRELQSRTVTDSKP